MTDPAAHLDALPEAVRAEATTRVLDGKSDAALSTLHLADREAGLRLLVDAVAVLSRRLGVDMRCTTCFTTPAHVRDDYPFGMLCDSCSAATTAWPCCDCGAPTAGDRALAGGPCRSCRLDREWAALPAEVRDEIDRVMAGPPIMAIKRIRDLTGCGLKEGLELHEHRYNALRGQTP